MTLTPMAPRMPVRQAAQEISYAWSARSKGARVLIRAIENATGRIGLIRRARGYEHDIAQGADFWQVMAERYGLGVEVTGGALSNIPQTGPLVLIANHPYGILDGLIMGLLLSRIRSDFRILAHNVFKRAEEIDRIILPVDFSETKEAAKANLRTRAEALRYLGDGGAIGVFPGGTVSTAARPFGAPMDPGWRNFTARMIAKSDATVVPVFFAGHNSRLFQLASHLHYSLRMGLMIREFKRHARRPVRLVIGAPIPQADLAPLRESPKQMMDFLRRATYDLSPTPLKSYGYGFEFEAKYRN